MASDLDLAVRTSKKFEAALHRRFGAEGRGLHERIDAALEAKHANTVLTSQIVRDLRLIATVRNKLVHEEGYNRIDRRQQFTEARKRAERALKLQRPPVAAIVIISTISLAAIAVVVARLQGWI